MHTFEFEVPTSERPHLPFPPEIGLDPGVLFHGTSSHAEDAIERDGLSASDSDFTIAEIQQVLALFDMIGWTGSGASHAVLWPFSSSDLRNPRGKPVYLAERPHRALLYASLDFAGGEIARGLRHAFDDLSAYALDPLVREQHRQQVALGNEAAARRGSRLRELPSEDQSRLRDELRRLDDLRQRADAPLETCSHGVVYAVRLHPADLAQCEFHGSMGVRSYARLAPDRIIAKAVVPSSYKHDSFAMGEADFPPALDGVIAAIKNAS